MYTNDEVDEIFSSFFSSYLNSYKGSSEAKIKFLEDPVKDIETILEVLEKTHVVLDPYEKQEVYIHVLQDPFTILLESSVKAEFVLFISTGTGFRWEFELPFFEFLFLTKDSQNVLKLDVHVLDWLCWTFEIT